MPAADRGNRGPGQRPRSAPQPEDEPTILCVGSLEPRKNHAAVLYAAETLWREGRRFRVQLIGGSGWGTTFPY